MEALASGTAIVASRVGALPEMFDEGRQGFLCSPGDYASFAGRIGELVSDRERLQEFKREARAFAQRRLDITLMLDSYERALRELAARVD